MSDSTLPDRLISRSARAVVFATVCLTLTAAGHAFSAGAAVPAAGIGLGFLFVAGVAALLAGTERSYPTILGGLLGAQFGLHVLFVQISDGTVHHGLPHTGHAHGGAVMTLAHTLAALIAAWWLRRGEAAAWSLARRIAAAARPPRPMLPDVTVPARTIVRPAARILPARTASLRHSVSRRGPPRALSLV
ncbi:MFS transporter [Spirillospora sp. NPDC052269]